MIGRKWACDFRSNKVHPPLIFSPLNQQNFFLAEQDPNLAQIYADMFVYPCT